MTPPAAARPDIAARLDALVEKYRMLAALTAGAPGRTTERRDAMRAIAERFPAAMREWDESPPEELRRRLALAEALAGELQRDGETALSRWRSDEAAVLRYGATLHERLRSVLAVKRFLGGRELSEVLRTEAERRFGLPRDELEAIALPARGRITDAVYATVAAAEGISVEELKRVLFPGRH